MSNPTVRNNKSFVRNVAIMTAVLGILPLCNNANATAMKTLADANNKFYRDVRDLGPNAKPSQIMTLESRDYGPGLKELQSEHAQHYKDYKTSIKKLMLTKAEFLEIFGYPLGTKGPHDPNDPANANAKKQADLPKAPTGREGAQVGTGEQGGADGAKKVELGGKQIHVAPPVNADGIGTY